MTAIRLDYGDHNWQALVRPSHTEDGSPQVLPRRSLYGSQEAIDMGLLPVTEVPDMLIAQADWKQVIADCHAQQVFPVYHQKASGVLAKGWDQDGYGFCWAYGLTMSVMDCRAAEGLPPVRLSPFSLGWLTGWRNQGFYCDTAIKGARDKGIAPLEFVPEYNLRPSSFKSGWEQEALKYRPAEWWDTQPSRGAVSMISQCLAILATGRPLYVAFNWWSHALQVCALEWDESKPNNIVWVLRNSHAESDVIRLTGSRGVPDEAYGVRATLRV